VGRTECWGYVSEDRPERNRDQERKLLSELDNNKRTHDASGWDTPQESSTVACPPSWTSRA